MGKSFLQIVSPESELASAGIMLFFDEERYLFNVGEGFQRIANELKIRLSRIHNIFVSRLHPHRIGGLPGLILTLADKGIRDTTIHGPQNLVHVLMATRFFIHRNILSFGVNALSDSTDHVSFAHPVFCDERLVVFAVPTCSACMCNEPSTRSKTEDRLHVPSVRELFPRIVLPIPVVESQGEEGEEMCVPDTATDFAAEKRAEEDMLRNAASASLPPPHSASNNDTALTYIIHTADQPGKFDPEAAKRLGVPRGPMFSSLTKGESVTLADGRMVHPRDVVGPATPGTVIIIADCPTLEHADMLVQKDVWHRYQEDHEQQNVKDRCRFSRLIIVHTSPLAIVSHRPYAKWASSFGADTVHLMCTPQFTHASHPYASSIRAQAMLNATCPTYFDFSDDLYFTPSSSSSSTTNASTLSESAASGGGDSSVSFVGRMLRGDTLAKYHIAPIKASGFDASEVLRLPSYQDHVTAMHQRIPSLAYTVDMMKSAVLSSSVDHDHRPDGTLHSPVVEFSVPEAALQDEIVFLGTGSACPSKYRNVSGILIRMHTADDNYKSLLIDSGEASLTQIRRVFGPKEADSVIRSVSTVWISHMHGDHHIGLVRFMFERHQLFPSLPPLVIIGPTFLQLWLDEFCRATSAIPFVFYDNAQFLGSPLSASAATSLSISPSVLSENDLMSLLELRSLQTVSVIHCRDAYGLIIEHATHGWKLVYSGDTRPCPRLIAAGRDCTVLVHEATFEDALVAEAIDKNHSTTGEAVASGTEMRAWRTVLTHFSQRYPKVPVFDESHRSCTCVAFDLMRIRMKDLATLPCILPTVRLLFQEEEKEDSKDEDADDTL